MLLILQHREIDCNRCAISGLVFKAKAEKEHPIYWQGVFCQYLLIPSPYSWNQVKFQTRYRLSFLLRWTGLAQSSLSDISRQPWHFALNPRYI